MRKSVNLLIFSAVALNAISAFAQLDTRPRHVAELSRAGFLAMPTGSPPEATAVAGQRFLELVPDSQKEVCRVVLEHGARAMPGLYRLRVIDELGRTVLVCSL